MSPRTLPTPLVESSFSHTLAQSSSPPARVVRCVDSLPAQLCLPAMARVAWRAGLDAMHLLARGLRVRVVLCVVSQNRP